MAIGKQALRRWAQGAQGDAMMPAPDNPTEMDDEDFDDEMDEDLDDEGNPGERNLLWAGEDEETDLSELTPELAEDLMLWLEENEPDIYAALEKLGEAIEVGDQRLIDDAKMELSGAEQYLNPDYPPLSDEQQAAASENISALSREGKSWPGGKRQMIAVGLAKARRGERV